MGVPAVSTSPGSAVRVTTVPPKGAVTVRSLRLALEWRKFVVGTESYNPAIPQARASTSSPSTTTWPTATPLALKPGSAPETLQCRSSIGHSRAGPMEHPYWRLFQSEKPAPPGPGTLGCGTPHRRRHNAYRARRG